MAYTDNAHSYIFPHILNQALYLQTGRKSDISLLKQSKEGSKSILLRFLSSAFPFFDVPTHSEHQTICLGRYTFPIFPNFLDPKHIGQYLLWGAGIPKSRRYREHPPSFCAPPVSPNRHSMKKESFLRYIFYG